MPAPNNKVIGRRRAAATGRDGATSSGLAPRRAGSSSIATVTAALSPVKLASVGPVDTPVARISRHSSIVWGRSSLFSAKPASIAVRRLEAYLRLPISAAGMIAAPLTRSTALGGGLPLMQA